MRWEVCILSLHGELPNVPDVAEASLPVSLLPVSLLLVTQTAYLSFRNEFALAACLNLACSPLLDLCSRVQEERACRA